MDHRKLNAITGGIAFIVALVVYVLTLSPTVVFWDVGEFIAAAYSLQVPHPPGAPLFLLVARIFIMIPFVADIAVRAHFISALASALTVLFTYLISSRLMVTWKGAPQTGADKIIFHGSALIGALALTFSPTFWFNAVEAEVYGLSMLFVSGIVWLALYWYDHHERRHSDVYLVFIAYLIGLSLGIHLLALLALFSVMMLVYLRYHEESLVKFFTTGAFLKFGIIAVLIFFTVYPGIVKYLPSMLDGEFQGKKSELWPYVVYALIAIALYGVYWSTQKKNRIVNIASLSFLFIFLGFTTYTMVYIRANADPPMNENDPRTIAKLVSYLGREQYGNAPIIERRWGQDPDQVENHKKYTSDFDYFWRYQMNHMYLRYFGWNYIGKDGDLKEAGVKFSDLFAIPLLLGFIGMYFHWKNDQKMAFVMTVFFIIMGAALVYYFNMQEPQPRERDYFYVGSFFAFCIWIGMGAYGLANLIREKIQGANGNYIAYGKLALLFIFVPVNMARVNWKEADRTGNYVAWDYSYNLLQSLEPDAILFTNGDNDTFPLWYLQDVEGIRRDVRVANLSLLNTNWYVHQLKNTEPYGSKKVPISLSDAQIQELQPIQWQTRQMDLPVPSPVKRQYSGDVGKAAQFGVGPAQDTVKFVLQPTLQVGNITGLRVQDIMVYDIIRTSNWERPVYFAMTVADDGKIGLRDYMELQGLAFKLTPRPVPNFWAGLNEDRMVKNLFTDIEQPSKEPQLGFRWRNLNNPKVYYDEDIRRLSINYRQSFFALALYYANVKGRGDMVDTVFNRMEQLIPRSVIPIDYRLKFDIGSLYGFAGNPTQQKALVREVIDELTPVVEAGVSEPLTQYNPYIILMQSYEILEEWEKASELLDKMRAAYPSVPGIDEFITQRKAQFDAERAVKAKRDSARLDTARAGK